MGLTALTFSPDPSLRPLLFVALCQAVGILGAWHTRDGLKSWYPRLRRPFFTPPPWVFGPVWTVLYVCIGLAGARVSHDPACLALFGWQLLLNAAWSYLFFGCRRPDLSLADIVLLWASIALCVHQFGPVDPVAAQLLWPYWAWVSFATLLNFEFWRLNRASLSVPLEGEPPQPGA